MVVDLDSILSVHTRSPVAQIAEWRSSKLLVAASVTVSQGRTFGCFVGLYPRPSANNCLLRDSLEIDSIKCETHTALDEILCPCRNLSSIVVIPYR